MSVKAPIKRTYFCPEVTKADDLHLDQIEKLFDDRGIKKSFKGEASKERVFKFRSSDGTPDRYGDIIDPKGWVLDQYKKNPVILSNHNAAKGPIGKSLSEEVTEDGLYQVLYIHDLDEHADHIYRLLDAGMLRMSSVGFRGLETKKVTDHERNELKMSPYGVYYTKQELFELSVVTIPANPNASLVKNNDQTLVDEIKRLVDSKFEDIYARLGLLGGVDKAIGALEEKVQRLIDVKEVKKVEDTESSEFLDTLLKELKS